MKLNLMLIGIALFSTGCGNKTASIEQDTTREAFSPALASENVKIKISEGDLLANQDKIDIIQKYEVLERLIDEVEEVLDRSPGTEAEIEIYGFRLRSGTAGFLSFSGPDFLSGDVTIKEKGKQIAFFSADIRGSKGGKHHPPTRRVIALVKSFGEDIDHEINKVHGTLVVPNIENIDITIPTPGVPNFRFGRGRLPIP